jgi:hypothetical protein
VSFVAPEGAEAGTADKQRKTNYIEICVIACPLYNQGSQQQVCKEHAMTQILNIEFVSFVAPEGAEAGTADRQRKTQMI